MSVEAVPDRIVPGLHEEGIIFEPGELASLSQNSLYCSFANDRVILFPETNVIRVDEEWHKLTKLNFKFLTLLAMRSGLLVPYHTISEEVWGPYYDAHSTNSINQALGCVRTILGRNDLGHPQRGAIQTYRNVGLKALP